MIDTAIAPDIVAATVIAVGPRLDCRNVGPVRREIDAAIAEGPCAVVLDISELDAIDATALGMLTAAHLRAGQAGSTLLLRGPRAGVRRILAVTRLNRILRIERGFADLR